MGSGSKIAAFAVFFLAIFSNFSLRSAGAFPGKGSGGLGFNPAGDSEGTVCLNLFGVDLNALYSVSEQFVNRNCHEVGSGGFSLANNHVIMNSEYPEALRQELEDSGYNFLGNTPMEDLLAKLVSIRFEVRNEATGKVKVYKFVPTEIANTWDYINDDQLVCNDFFPDFCESGPLGVPGSSPMVAFLPKIPPQAPGSYSIDMYYVFEGSFNAGFGIGPDFPYNFDSGEALVFPNFFEVVKGAIQSKK